MFNKILLLLALSTSITYGQKAIFPGKGMQPSVCVGENESIEIVFGKGNVIYYTFSKNKGQSFASPIPVDSLPGLHLGMSRGPQIASSKLSTVITAIDKKGDLYAYVLNRKTGEWGKRFAISDVPEIAKEGFNALASDGQHTFFVIWLDLRNDRKNKIFGAVSKDGGKTWAKNKLIYRSPDSTVCECCQPSVIMDKNQVFVMYRNWINGSRDMYVTASKDGGNTFLPAQKMGNGTWKLNACPMDGGAISLNKKGILTTVWRREGQLFKSNPGEPESLISSGRNASIATTNQNTFITWQNQNQVWLIQSGQSEPISLGNGRYPRIVSLNERQAFCVWEDNGSITGKLLNEKGK